MTNFCLWTFNRYSETWEIGCNGKVCYASPPDICPHCGLPTKEVERDDALMYC